MSKFKVGDRVRVLRHRAFGGNDVGATSGMVGKTVILGKTQQDLRSDDFETFSIADEHGATGWLVRSDDIELLPVAPQQAGPIRTVTRREIVPGVYGRVCVEKGRLPFMASACLVDRSNKKHSEVNYLDASELREAARIFNEIADVLEEGK